MSIPFADGDDAFPTHMYHAFGQRPRMFEDRIGGAIIVAEKRPEGGPVTVMTTGVSRFAIDGGLPVELAVEVVDGQQGAAFVALRSVCDDIAQNRRTPPMGMPWRNSEPFLNGTQISAIVATGSRWGAEFDEVRGEDGRVVGHVRTLRMLTDAEAQVAGTRGWDALVAQAGSVDALLDVERASTVAAPPAADSAADDPLLRAPIILTKLHEQHPPRWVTFHGDKFSSVVGTESPAYMNDDENHTVWAAKSFLDRFPWVEGFLRTARPGQTARFDAADGSFVIEDD